MENSSSLMADTMIGRGKADVVQKSWACSDIRHHTSRSDGAEHRAPCPESWLASSGERSMNLHAAYGQCDGCIPAILAPNRDGSCMGYSLGGSNDEASQQMLRQPKVIRGPKFMDLAKSRGTFLA